MRVPPAVMEEAKSYLLDYCDLHVPPQMRDQIRLEIEQATTSFTIVERRPPWRDDEDRSWSSSPVARLNYDPLHAQWALDWSDSDGEWHPYTGAAASPDIADLVDEVDADPTNIFWG